MRGAAVFVSVAVMAVGCGGEDREESPAADDARPVPAETQPTTTTVEEPRSASSYAIIGAEGQGDPRPIDELYGVFSRPGTSREEQLTKEAANFAGGCGEPVAGQTRILMTDVGARHLDLVAVPTTEGSVAYGLLPTGGGGCGRPLAGGLMMAGDIGPDTVLHYGLVPDDVESLEIVLDGVAHKARIARNGFAVEVEGTEVGRVVVHRHDGTTQKY